MFTTVQNYGTIETTVEGQYKKGEFHRLIGLYKIDNDCGYFSNSIYQIFRLLHGEYSANHFIFINLINPSNNPGKVLLSFLILQ